MTETIPGRVLHPGIAEGFVLKLEKPLSFWGGVDPVTGRIVDQAHPNVGCNIADTVLAMASSRGSSGTPGVLGEMLRLGTGPAAIVLTKPDINLVAGALVAQVLYGKSCPIVLVGPDTFNALGTNTPVRAGIER